MTNVQAWLSIILAPVGMYLGFRAMYNSWKSLKSGNIDGEKSVYKAEMRREYSKVALVMMIACGLLVIFSVACIILAIMDDHGLLGHK